MKRRTSEQIGEEIRLAMRVLRNNPELVSIMLDFAWKNMRKLSKMTIDEYVAYCFEFASEISRSAT